jgi:hypothetical protein
MARMVRKQVYITLEHAALLKRRAKELGVSEAELIRRGIDRVGRAPADMPFDPTAWEEELAFIRQRARLRTQAGESGQPRGWTRAELYEE